MLRNTYQRFIPRDFFNESKLLKCFGQLSLKIHDRMLPDGLDINITEHGQRFIIELDEDNSRLYISNYKTTINGVKVKFHSPYNSKGVYPFYCLHQEIEYEVFNDDGSFTEEFINIPIN